MFRKAKIRDPKPPLLPPMQQLSCPHLAEGPLAYDAKELKIMQSDARGDVVHVLMSASGATNRQRHASRCNEVVLLHFDLGIMHDLFILQLDALGCLQGSFFACCIAIAPDAAFSSKLYVLCASEWACRGIG